MKTPIIHPRTEQYLSGYLARPSHALLLTGPSGMGKTFLAKWIGSTLNKEILVIEAASEKQGITIEQIRTLYNLTKTGSDLVVILEHIDTMSHAAQNAFLKLLEEPPENIVFIVTANSPHGILATIRSRAQHIDVVAPAKSQLQPLIKNHNTTESLLHTSGGKPGIFFSLLEEDENRQAHETNVTAAKQFYTNSTFERHMYCISINFEKTALQSLLDMLAIIIQTLLRVPQQKTATHKKLVRQAALVEQTAVRILEQNGNPKAHMTKLCQEL